MHPMFVQLYMEPDADEDERDKRRRAARARRLRTRAAVRVTAPAANRDRLAARRAQAAEFARAGVVCPGDLGHEQRRMRADRGRDQHLDIPQRLPDVPELTVADGRDRRRGR